jgi:hypothetical protein
MGREADGERASHPPRAILGAPAQDFVLIRRSRRYSARFAETHRRRVFGEGAEDGPRGRLAHPPSSAIPFLLLGGRSPFSLASPRSLFDSIVLSKRHSGLTRARSLRAPPHRFSTRSNGLDSVRVDPFASC